MCLPLRSPDSGAAFHRAIKRCVEASMSQAYRSHEERSTARRKWMNVPPGMTPDLADEFMRLNAGERVRRITSGDKRCGPALVTPQRFKKHCELHPEWADEARRLARDGACHWVTIPSAGDLSHL
ncbi:hypothetical protein BST63_16865 [Bradyrhizobium canariense]|uniref:Uncharacterized protein n=1 Tax=Bradyrhizobium canariense TaxID=255045 RepID=A0ABX3X2J2_9BRAD|nr:hypothetical protein BSR47_18950 [Bradyrhizobium canariense]OSJ28412.1 hypothetical protein BST63_16865 [Bradyrhizobium canariense]